MDENDTVARNTDKTKLEVTISSGGDEEEECLICGNKPYYNYCKPQGGPGQKTWAKWKQDCGQSLCSLLSMSSDPFQLIMAHGPYCTTCSTLVWDIHFTLEQVAALQSRLHTMKGTVEDKLGIHYRQLQEDVDQHTVGTSSSGRTNAKRKGKISVKTPRKTHFLKLRAVEVIIEELLQRGTTQGLNYFGNAVSTMNGAPDAYDEDYFEYGQFSQTSPTSERTDNVETDQEGYLKGEAALLNNSETGRSRTDKRKLPVMISQNKVFVRDFKGLIDSEVPESDAIDPGWIIPDLSDEQTNSTAENKLLPLTLRELKIKTTQLREEKTKRNKNTKRNRIKRVRVIEQHPCHECPQICVSRRALEDHVRSAHPELRFECKVCSVRYKLESSLKAHTKNMHSEKYSLYCRTCQKGCVTQEELAEHEQIHNSSVPFTCSVCQEVFTNSKDLERHVRSHDNPFMCEQCPKCYTNEEDLKEHIKFHVRNVQCEVCGLSCHSGSRLRQHLETHTSIKRFPCNLCNLSYKYMKGLRIHQRLHTGERPFVCKICEKSFYDSGHLKKHEEIHAGTKTYVCSTCGKGFYACQNLKQHELIHDKTKPRKKRAPRIKKEQETTVLPFLLTNNAMIESITAMTPYPSPNNNATEHVDGISIHHIGVTPEVSQSRLMFEDINIINTISVETTEWYPQGVSISTQH